MPEKDPFSPKWLHRLMGGFKADFLRLEFPARFLQVCRYAARELREHRARQMAAALTFHTIFALIPVVVLAILIFRALGGEALLGEFIDQLLASIRLQDLAGPEPGVTLGEWARDAVDNLNENLSARTIGVIGGLGLGWAAISLLTTIERAFNTICNAPQPRSLVRRLPLYWTTVTVGPALLYLSFHLESRLLAWFQNVGFGYVSASVVGTAASFIATWLFLLTLYKLMPHTGIGLAACVMGSFVAAVFWTGATGVFNGYVDWSFGKDSSAFKMLYGTVGLIPLFMLWIYILWMIVLFGLELTNLVQVVGRGMAGTLPTSTKLPPLTDAADIVPVTQVVAARFAHGMTTSVDQVVEQTRLNAGAVTLMLEALADAALLRRVEKGDDETFALGRPAEAISTKELLEVAQRLTANDMAKQSEAWNWVRRYRHAQLELAVHRPLADLKPG